MCCGRMEIECSVMSYITLCLQQTITHWCVIYVQVSVNFTNIECRKEFRQSGLVCRGGKYKINYTVILVDVYLTPVLLTLHTS